MRKSKVTETVCYGSSEYTAQLRHVTEKNFQIKQTAINDTSLTNCIVHSFDSYL